MTLIDRLHLIPDPKLHVSVLTGADISTESEVPIFRGEGSMWENEKIRELARKACPLWNTKGTWEFYKCSYKCKCSSTGISTSPVSIGFIATQEFKEVEIVNILCSSRVFSVIASITCSELVIRISYVVSITSRSALARDFACS